MKIMKKISVAMVICAGIGWAQSALFMKMGAGSREMAMGGAATATTMGASAVFWNPAGVARTDQWGVFASHAEHFQGIRFDNISAYKSFGFGTLFMFGGGLYVGGFEGRTGPSPEPEWEFSAFDYYAGLGYARALGPVYMGLSGKFYSSKIDQFTASAFAGDAGFVYASKYLDAGISLRNMGTGLRYNEESSPAPGAVNLGVAFKPSGFTTASVDLAKSFAWDGVEIHSGVEAVIANMLALRAGFSNEISGEAGDEALKPDLLSMFWFGAGIRAEGLSIDYVFKTYDFLGNSHRLSLTYSPGLKGTDTRIQEREKLAQEYQKKTRITAESFYSSAMDYYGQGNLEEALANLDRALLWDPEYQEAKDMYQKISEEKRVKDAEAYVNRGIELYNQSDFINAITEFEKALELDPGNSLATKWQENAFTAMVELQKTKYKKKQQMAGKVSDLMKQGVSYYSKGKYSKAESKFNEVLEIDPNNQEAKQYLQLSQNARKTKAQDMVRKAQAYEAKSNYAKAISYYKKALSYDPSNPDANKGLANARANAGKLASQHLAKGKELYNKGDLSAAESEFRAALNLDPALTEPKTYLSKIASKRKSQQKKFVDPAVVQDLYLKGVDAYVKEDYESAVYYWQKVLELDPTNSKAKANLAKAKKRLNK